MENIIKVEQSKSGQAKSIIYVIISIIILFSTLNNCYADDYPGTTPETAIEDNSVGISLSASSKNSITVKISDTNNWTGQYPKGSNPKYTLKYHETINRRAEDISRSISHGSQTIILDGLKPDTKYSVWVEFNYTASQVGTLYRKTSMKNINTKSESDGSTDTVAVCEGDFWECAGSWFGSNEGGIPGLPEEAQDIIDQLLNYINIVGTAAFIIVTAYLGIKYMYGSVESKADIKESMITLLVAAVFFFGWQSIMNILLYSGTGERTDTIYFNAECNRFSKYS